MRILRIAATLAVFAATTGCFFEGFKATPAGGLSELSSMVGGTVAEKAVIEDTELSFSLVNKPNSRISFKILSQPSLGTITAFDAATGQLSYRPNPNVSGTTDTIQFQIILDNNESQNPETYSVLLRIQPVNDLPLVADTTVTLTEDTPGFVNATGTDVDNDPLAYVVVTPPTKGSVQFDAANSRWLYTPMNNANGADSFTFRARDSVGESLAAGTVSITITPVNDVPALTAPAAASLNEDTTVTITAAGQDADGDALTYEMITAPANGTAVLNGATWTYTPRANYNGNDSFTFRARDAATTSATVTAAIAVAPVNDAPVMAAQSFAVVGGQTLTATLIASDVENDALTLQVTTMVQRGVLNIGANRQFTYTPVNGYFGPDFFDVVANDGKVNSAPVRINISVEEFIDESLLAKNLVANCATNTSYNACIFWKNPVAQLGAPFPAVIGANTNLSAQQIHAVNIPPTWYDNSGFFRNSTFDLYLDTPANNAGRVPTAGGNFKFAYGNDANRRVGQVITFYWLMLQMKYMKQRLGTFFAEAKNIKVFSSEPGTNAANNAYYDPSVNEVHLGRDSDFGTDMGLGSEVTLHEMGHANAEHATSGAIGINDGLSTKICRAAPTAPANVCCITKDGCSWAIGEGMADHHAAIMFFDVPALGETYMNRLDGLDTCGILRNSLKNANLTANQVYTACGVNNNAPLLNGEVHGMGSLYASIWYELRKAARAQGGADALDIDKLFNEHLKVITGPDTFVTIYNKLRSIDTALFGGKFGARLQAEFQRRGVI